MVSREKGRGGGGVWGWALLRKRHGCKSDDGVNGAVGGRVRPPTPCCALRTPKAGHHLAEEGVKNHIPKVAPHSSTDKTSDLEGCWTLLEKEVGGYRLVVGTRNSEKPNCPSGRRRGPVGSSADRKVDGVFRCKEEAEKCVRPAQRRKEKKLLP